MKKIVVLIIILHYFSLFTSAQSGYLELIEKGNFETAEKRIKKAIQKEPYDIGVNFSYAILLADKNYSGYDPYTSYNHIQIAQNFYRELRDEKEIKNLSKVPINTEVLISALDMICKRALDDAISKNTIAEYDKYLLHFKNAPIMYRSKAVENKNLVAFKAAESVNTILSYETFISSYPDAIEIPKAILKRNELVFAEVEASGGIEDYKHFINKYPKALQVDKAILKIHELAFLAAEKSNTSEAFQSFIKEYPKSKQYKIAYAKFEELEFSENTVPGDLESYKRFYQQFSQNSRNLIALDSVFSIARRTNNFSEIEYYIENTDGERRKSGLLYFHDIYTDDGEKKTLDAFYEKFDDDLLQDIKAKDYELAGLADDLKMEYGYNETLKDSYDYYIKNAAPRERAFVALQKFISNDIMLKNWTSAIEKVKIYKPYFSAHSKKVDNLLQLLERPYDNTIKIQAYGPEINTKEGGEYVPVVTADGKTMYFCGRDRKDNIGGEDVYAANLKTRSIAKVVSDLSFSSSNDAPVSISTDGNKLIMFISGKLNTSDKTLTGWDTPIPFEDNINAGTWQADAMISSDGKALLFASIRKGNFDYYIDDGQIANYHAENSHASDIYVSLKNENGEWGDAINLGPTINTIYGDRSPFLHPDMKTLYFTSSGHGGLGAQDVFKSTRLNDSCWTCWSEPVNLGKEINTPQKDWSYTISTNGEKAFFAKSASPTENDNIYWLNLPPHLRPDLVATISGKLLDRNNRPVNAEILWEDLETGKNIGKSKSDPVDGSYFIVLPLGKIYGYYVDRSEYFPLSSNIDLRKKDKAVDIENTIELVTFQEMIDKGIAVPINNLFFEFGKFDLLSYSIPELKRVAQIIKKEDLKVEIAGHTDNIGEEKDNQILSERRANAVKDFLTNEGCNPDKLVVVGFGESKPVSTNDTESGRAKNRRVEMKFIN